MKIVSDAKSVRIIFAGGALILTTAQATEAAARLIVAAAQAEGAWQPESKDEVDRRYEWLS